MTSYEPHGGAADRGPAPSGDAVPDAVRMDLSRRIWNAAADFLLAEGPGLDPAFDPALAVRWEDLTDAERDQAHDMALKVQGSLFVRAILAHGHHRLAESDRSTP